MEARILGDVLCNDFQSEVWWFALFLLVPNEQGLLAPSGRICFEGAFVYLANLTCQLLPMAWCSLPWGPVFVGTKGGGVHTGERIRVLHLLHFLCALSISVQPSATRCGHTHGFLPVECGSHINK